VAGPGGLLGQRDLVHAIKAAMDSVATFKLVPLDAKNPKDAVPQGRSRPVSPPQPQLGADLIVEQRGKNRVISEKSKIKNVNVNQRVQKLMACSSP
jgi:hypothetical protein